MKNHLLLVAGTMAVLLMAVALPCTARVLCVSPDGNDANDGLSWASAKRTIGNALASASSGDEIWVRYGVYQERIILKNRVNLYGGFRGTESDLSQRPTFPRPEPDPFESAIDGGQQGTVVTCPSGVSSRLDGFTATNGYTGGDSGGTYCASSAVTIANCQIVGNRAGYGGGVYCHRSSPTLTGCTFSSVDPQVVAGHLLPGSPCIDMGDSTAVTTQEDIDGKTRIYGANVDIGADEYQAPIIQGTLCPQHYEGNLSTCMTSAELRGAIGSGLTRWLWLDPDGGFVVASVPTNTRWLSVHPPRFLRCTVPTDASTGSVLGVEVDLVNGDIDGDNEGTLFDLGRLVAVVASMPGDENWDPNADLDGDEEVTLFDLGVSVSNFGEIGDD